MFREGEVFFRGGRGGKGCRGVEFRVKGARLPDAGTVCIFVRIGLPRVFGSIIVEMYLGR